MTWQERLRQRWSGLRFGNVQVETADGAHNFRVQAYLDDLDPGRGGNRAVRRTRCPAARRHAIKLTRGEPLVGAAKGWTYVAQVKTNRPAEDFTARMIPRHPEASIPLEAAQILWQR